MGRVLPIYKGLAWARRHVWRTHRTTCMALLTGAAYYVGAQLGFALTFPSSPLSVIWPPNAFLFVALLLVPRRAWWIMLLAVAPAHLLVGWQDGIPASTMLGLYGTNCAEAVLAAIGVRRFADGPPWLNDLRQIVAYVGCAVLFAPFVTSFLDAGVDVLTRWSMDYWLLWQERLLSDALTFLTVPPVLLIAISTRRRWMRAVPSVRTAEGALVAAGIFATGALSFASFGQHPGIMNALVYAPLPFLLWAAVRFGVGGTSAALLGITLLSSIWGSSLGTASVHAPSPVGDVLAVQLSLIALSTPFLCLAAVMQERDQRDQALRESEERYRAFFELSAVGTAQADPTTGQLLRVNDAYCQITGYPRAELLQMSFRELIHPADRDTIWQTFRQNIEDKVPAFMMEKRHVCKDGRTIWVQVDAEVVRDEAARPLHTVAIIQDITERKRADQALRESEERFRAMADTAPVMIWVSDTNSLVTFVNVPWLNFTGRAFEQELGNGWVDGVHGDDCQRCMETFMAAFRARQNFTMEYRLRRADGEYRWILDSGVPRFAPDGSFLGYIGSAVDITDHKLMEEALRASETRYRDLVETQTEMICRYLPDGTLTFVNDAYCRHFGRTREELIGTCFLDLLPAPEAERARTGLIQFMQNPGVVNDEHEAVMPDGQRIWQQWIEHAIRRADGAVIEIQAIGQDITERKLAERGLRASEARFRAAFESAATGMMLVGTDGKPLQVNQPLVKMLGYSEEELCTRTFGEFTYPDDLDANLELFRKAIAGEIDSYQMEKRFVHKQGHLVWGLLSAGIVRDEAGQPLYFVGQVQDITKRKVAEQSLRQSEERFRAVVETQTELIGRFLPDTTLTFVNDAYCRCFGKSREELLGTKFLALLPESSRARVDMAIQSLVAHPGILTIEHEGLLRDGSIRWQQWVNRTILDADGRVVELQGIGRDVTERKQAEEALERLATRLLEVQDEERRRIARELHDSTAQAVAAINLNLTNLQWLMPEEYANKERVQRLLADSQSLAEQAMGEMRTLSYVLHPPQLDEAGLVPAVRWYVKGFSERSGIRVDLVAPTNLGRLPVEVERALFRVVQECLTNVHRHSRSSTARIVLRRTGRAVRLVVADQGGGIARADGREGLEDVLMLGVGIPGMRQRLRQLGGRLRIRSGPDGTTVMAIVLVPEEALVEAYAPYS